MPQTVLVTGAFGNVGSSTIGHLLAKGHRVRAVDLKSLHTASLAARFGDQLTIIWGDIRDPSLWPSALAGVDAVIHLAAMIPPGTERAPQRAHAVNVVATRELVRQMEWSPTAKRLVFASSMTVAGCEQHRRTPPLRVDEMPQPADVYGRGKLECEQRIRDSDLDWSILRLAVCPPAALSKKDAAGFDNIFETSADGRIELIHTDDAGLAFANAVSCRDAIGRTLYLGGGAACRSLVLDFYNRMFAAMGLRPLDPRLLRPGPPRFFGDWVDTDESQRLLRFQRHTLDDILGELRASLGRTRCLLRAAAPVIGWMLARRSPHFRHAC
ncbi:MAG TPA: NAD(P)-dependent oxidoreductase [Solimonas sp.]|nr:NAD(P)-dependent oxidoreductase [Solimonas sp.]